MFYYIYVLESKKDGEWYTGCTKDLKTRLRIHDEGKVKVTKDRRPLKIIYSEACRDKYDAYRREKFLKSGPGKRYLKNRLKNYLNDKVNEN